MGCPNCGADGDHVVVNSVVFCRVCGPRVWGARESTARSGQAEPQPTAAVEVAVVGARTRGR